MKKILIEITQNQHTRLHTVSDKIGRPAKKLLEGILTDFPKLSEQEKRETLRALKFKESDAKI